MRGQISKLAGEGSLLDIMPVRLQIYTVEETACHESKKSQR